MTRNLKLDVILLVYKVNVILLVFICDENVFVMTPCGGCQILAGSRIQPVIWWLPNPDWFQDAASKQANYCSGGLRIGNKH
jgi:hypothetical protein